MRSRTDWFPPEITPAYHGTYLVRKPNVSTRTFWAAFRHGKWRIISLARNDYRGISIRAPSYAIARNGIISGEPLEWCGLLE